MNMFFSMPTFSDAGNYGGDRCITCGDIMSAFPGDCGHVLTSLTCGTDCVAGCGTACTTSCMQTCTGLGVDLCGTNCGSNCAFGCNISCLGGCSSYTGN